MSFQIAVSEGVESLGLAFHSLPPGTVAIRQVVPGSWAEVQKLQVEDEVVYMNSSRVAEMTRHDFFKCIQERPLTLGVSRPAKKLSGTDVPASPLRQSVASASTASSPSPVAMSIASDDDLEKSPSTDDSDGHECDQDAGTSSGDDQKGVEEVGASSGDEQNGVEEVGVCCGNRQKGVDVVSLPHGWALGTELWKFLEMMGTELWELATRVFSSWTCCNR
jgi:hypothetical protein